MFIKKIIIFILIISVGVFTFADDGTVRVLMSTSQGDIEIDLYLDKAPITAGNFLSLIDNGDIDNGSFYRVVTEQNDNGNPKIKVIQGGLGGGNVSLTDKRFDTIDHETTEQTGILHIDGVISMARGAVGTASTEFFICMDEQPGLDFGETRNADRQGFAAFGRVVGGMEVVRKINGLPADAPAESAYTRGQILTEQVIITSVKRM